METFGTFNYEEWIRTIGTLLVQHPMPVSSTTAERNVYFSLIFKQERI